MNEQIYYIIKNLVNKVMKDLEHYEIIESSGVDCCTKTNLLCYTYGRDGLLDTRINYEIKEEMFDYRLRKAFNFLYNKVGDYQEKKLEEQFETERQNKIDTMNSYLGTTQYFK